MERPLSVAGPQSPPRASESTVDLPIMRALGARAVPGRGLLDLLQGCLQNGALLLVLDGSGQVAAATPLPAELLTDSPPNGPGPPGPGAPASSLAASGR